MLSREERLARRQAAYSTLVRADLGIILSRWALVKLLLRALISKRPAYELAFAAHRGMLNPAAHIVLADLRHLCQFDRGGLVQSPVTRTTDPLATAYRDGMRDVYIRILMMAGLDRGPKETLTHESSADES